MQVTILGAAGGIGQPLSLLLTMMPGIDRLHLYDIVHAKGVAKDLSHVNTGKVVKGFVGATELSEALQNSDVVVVPAGVPRKPNMTRDDLFKINAGIVRDLAQAVAQNCPRAFVLVISNPVNSTVPIFAEVLRRHHCFDPHRLFGVTTLDSVRAATFLSEVTQSKQFVTQNIPVVGGHSGHTIIPVFSAVNPSLSSTDWETLVKRVQFGGDEVVQAKEGAGSATLSMAFAAQRFVSSLIQAVQGSSNNDKIVESSYVCVDDASVEGATAIFQHTKCAFFASLVQLGRNGIEKILPFPELNEYEMSLLDKATTELNASIAKGVEFVSKL